MQIFDAAQCGRYQNRFYEALKECDKECKGGKGTLEDDARFLDRYSSSGLSDSLATFGCVCEKMALGPTTCKEVFTQCFGMGVGLPIQKPTPKKR